MKSVPKGAMRLPVYTGKLNWSSVGFAPGTTHLRERGLLDARRGDFYARHDALGEHAEESEHGETAVVDLRVAPAGLVLCVRVCACVEEEMMSRTLQGRRVSVCAFACI